MSGGQTEPAKKKKAPPEDPPRCFGDQIAADHVVANAEKSQGWTITLESIGYIPYLICSIPTAPAVLSARGGSASTNGDSGCEGPAPTIVKSAAWNGGPAIAPAGVGEVFAARMLMARRRRGSG